MSDERSAEPAACRLLCTLAHPPDEASGVRFAAVLVDGRRAVASEPVEDAELLARFLAVGGYERLTGGPEIAAAVDQALASRRLAPSAQQQSDQETIAGLIQSNQGMSAELYETRRERDRLREEMAALGTRLADLEAQLATGASGDVAALLAARDQQISELEGKLAQAGEQIADLEAQLAQATAPAPRRAGRG